MRRFTGTGVRLGLVVIFEALARLLRRQQLADLTGETGLISGGSRGLRWSLTREFGNEGRNVAICARASGELEAGRRYNQFATQPPPAQPGGERQ